MNKNYPSPKSKKLWKLTEKLIPCGVQTLSKMPNKFVEGQYPIYLDGGYDCYVYDDQNRYIDYPCGLGAVLLGYSNTEVNDAINALKTTSFNIEEDEDGEIIIKIRDSLDYLCDLGYAKSIFPILWKISK